MEQQKHQQHQQQYQSRRQSLNSTPHIAPALEPHYSAGAPMSLMEDYLLPTPFGDNGVSHNQVKRKKRRGQLKPLGDNNESEGRKKIQPMIAGNHLSKAEQEELANKRKKVRTKPFHVVPFYFKV
jgi:hypothetical protein